NLSNGTSVTLTALAGGNDGGSVFSGWTGGGCSGTGTCTVTLNSNTTVTATFSPKSGSSQNFTLSVSKNGTGSGTVTSAELGISCGAECSESYSTVTAGTITAQAAPGSTFAGWTGANCQTGSTCTLLVSADTTITASFVKNPNF